MSPSAPFGTGLVGESIVLASASASRRAMLAAAGVRFEAVPARIDERALEAEMARGGRIDWVEGDFARLQVRELSAQFIASYLDAEWPAVAGCVGCFRIEGPGVQLFERAIGDQFTVLGMPLFPVLGALRERGVLVP